MKNRFIALFAAACMAASLAAGCGNSESGGGASNDASAAGGDTAAAGDAADEGGKVLEDMADINMLYLSMGPIPQGLQAVEDAINEITEAEINTHVNIEMIETGNYEQQVNLKTSSNESGPVRRACGGVDACGLRFLSEYGGTGTADGYYGFASGIWSGHS